MDVQHRYSWLKCANRHGNHCLHVLRGRVVSAFLAATLAMGVSTTLADPQTHRVILLPPAFTEFQNAVSGLEVVPDWTRAARYNLGDAARVSLLAAGMELQPLPDLNPEESAVVRDYIDVAQLIVAAGALYDSTPWHQRREKFDRTLGEGLSFLRERTGADYALLIDGSQVRQSGGRVSMRILSTLAAATVGVALVSGGGGGEVLNLCLLDLNTGAVIWFNSSRTKNVLGTAGADMRDPVATQAAMKALIQPYPNIPALAD